MQKLSGLHLFRHVQKFAGDIGPRPAGHGAETKVRDMLEAHLRDLLVAGLSHRETSPWNRRVADPAKANWLLSRLLIYFPVTL